MPRQSTSFLKLLRDLVTVAIFLSHYFWIRFRVSVAFETETIAINIINSKEQAIRSSRSKTYCWYRDPLFACLFCTTSSTLLAASDLSLNMRLVATALLLCGGLKQGSHSQYCQAFTITTKTSTRLLLSRSSSTFTVALPLIRPFQTHSLFRLAARMGDDNDNTNDNKNNMMDTENIDIDTLSQMQVKLRQLLEQVQSLDYASQLPSMLETIQENMGQGQLGQRGEIYFLAQAVCFLCILTGSNLPIVGGLLGLLLGPVLLMLGVSMILISIVEMGPALSPWPQPPKNNNNNNKGLVTKGLYAEVRHPMYTGLLATSVGLSIVSDSATRLLLSLVLWYILDVKTNKEEEFLMEAYSKDYAKYKQQVPNKFLPKIVVDNLPSWGD